MTALWDSGEMTAEEIRRKLPADIHDSTVRTLLRVLEAKRYEQHGMRGKAFVYRAAVSRERVETKAVRNLLQRFFGGSAEALLLRLIEDEHLTPEQLEELQRRSGGERKRKRRS